MVHSLQYDYYKFPGGGLEAGETPLDAMIRETREEAGLVILPDTVREYGYVHRVQKSDRDETECFIQDNYYYLCKATQAAVSQKLDAYEDAEGFTLEFVEPELAIRKKRRAAQGLYDPQMCEREARVLELLTEEGLFL